MQENRRSRRLVTTATVAAALATMFTTAIPASSVTRAPSNDDVASATTLTRYSGSIGGTNVGATSEVADEGLPYYLNLPSVWYRWSAPSDGVVVFETCRRYEFDTMLAAIEFTTPTIAFASGFTQLEDNDDWDDDEPPLDPRRCSGTASAIHLEVTGGDTYYIGVTGYNYREGRFVLSWRFTRGTSLDD